MRGLLCVDDDPEHPAMLDALGSTLGLSDRDEVFVAHVIPTLRWLPGAESGWARVERDILKRVDDFLETTAELVSRTGATAHALRLEGDVALELLDAAEKERVDVIVAGALGQGRSQDFLVGSVAEKLLSLSERDLLLTRGANVATRDGLRVSIAIDDADTQARVLQSFVDKCRSTRPTVELIHVMQVPPPRFDAAPEGTRVRSPIPPVVKEHAERVIEGANVFLESHGFKPRLALRRGDPAREILSAAQAFDANLIVVGRSERKPGTRLAGWRGIVTRRVAQHAKCTVFVAATDPPKPYELERE